jgi:uncharacterized protein (TIGR03435 family)
LLQKLATDVAMSLKGMKKIITIVTLLVLVSTAICMKLFFFPSVKDGWFAMNRDHLLKVPPGLVVFRPTHFHDNTYRIIVTATYKHDGHVVHWIMGRDLPLRIAIAVAYSVNRATVVLPSYAPTNHFDFLITAVDDPPARLQSAIRRELGLVAHKETRETAVLAIKVADPYRSSLTLSDPAEEPGVKIANQKLCFTHVQINDLTDSFERATDIPVIDETELTNFYDFSVPWDTKTERQLTFSASSRAAIDKMLNAIGLKLEADNAEVDLLLVTHL